MALSLGEFARRHGVSVQAISKAVRAGRLARCVERDARGRPCIVNVTLADDEWATARSRPPRQAPGVQTSAQQLRRPAPGDVTLDECDGLLVLAVFPDEGEAFDGRRHFGVGLAPAEWVRLAEWIVSAAGHMQDEAGA